MKLDSAFRKPMLAIAVRRTQHEKVITLLMLGTRGSDEGGLDLFLISELVELQMLITDLRRRQAATNSPRLDTRVEMDTLYVHPTGTIYVQEGLLKFLDYFPLHQAILINPDGEISSVGSVNETRDLVSVLAEFYLPKGSARWSRQRMLVPQFQWGGTAEIQVFFKEASLKVDAFKVSPLMSPKKAKPESAQRRKAKKRAPRERNLYQNNYYRACASFLRLMMDKNRDGRAAIKSFKGTGPELHKLLIEFSSTISGAGATVLVSAICTLAYVRVQFDTSNVLTTSVGFGLFWLSWTVYKLRDMIVYINKCPGTLSSEEVEEMVRKLDKRVNDIYRAAAFTAVAVLSLS